MFSHLRSNQSEDQSFKREITEINKKIRRVPTNCDMGPVMKGVQLQMGVLIFLPLGTKKFLLTVQYVAQFPTGTSIRAINNKFRELKPALDAHSCHITNIEPLAP